MTNNNLRFFSVMLFASIIVSSYQLPLIENTLNKYGYENNLNEKITFSKNSQQFIEDQKISFSSYLDGENNMVKSIENEDIKSKELMSSVTLSIPKVVEIVSLPISTPKLKIANSLSKTKISIVPTVLKETAQLNQSGMQSSPNLESVSTDNSIRKTGSCVDNCTVLMIGDSVMGDIDFSMQRLIKKEFPSWKVIDGHKVSSGLTNQTYYDWPSTAKKLVEKYNPDYVFVLLGTNDAQGMMSNGKGLAFSKDLWLNEYSNRVNKMTEIIESAKASWFWIGLPVTKDKSFNSRLQFIRNIQAEQTKEHYISVESIFGKNDYSQPINLKLRAADGIHLNSSGADLVAKELMIQLKG